MIRTVAITLLILALLPLLTIGCQLGTGTQPASTPIPPVAATPTFFEKKLQSAPRSMELTKVIDGYLHVRYLPPCEIVPSPAEWVASIVPTDLQSGSIVYLNRDGTASRFKPDYRTEEGKATLEAALKDSSVVEQIVARPECPEIYRRVNVGEPRLCGGLDGCLTTMGITLVSQQCQRLDCQVMILRGAHAWVMGGWARTVGR